MKTKLLLSFSLLAIAFSITSAQVPQGFTYQAIARLTSGDPIINTTIPVKITIQADSLGTQIIWQELHNSVTTNGFGLMTLILGKGARQLASTVPTFNSIDWKVTPKFIKTEVNYGGWKTMGVTRLWSVPYALVADKANGVNSGTKLSVTSPPGALIDEALFEVKNKDGQTVFAVYPEGVRAYVADGAKGTKGGFAVGGFGAEKADPSYKKYFYADADSVRIYIDPTPGVKGSKGGFAVGGYNETGKGINDMYFNLTRATSVNTITNAKPQILWYPLKNAFLAGNIRVAHVDSVGDYSTALGYQSRAAGDYSQAFGYKAIAAGDYSTSIGKRSLAGVYNSKHNAFALGNATQATGDDSYAFGSGAKATGSKSFAFGSVGLDDAGNPTVIPTQANGDYSTAIGMGAVASAKGAMALGVGSTSSGTSSNSLGYYSTASGSYATALGYKSTAIGYASGVLGYTARADGPYSIAIGNNSYATSSAQYSVAIGDSAKVQGYYAAALGDRAKAKANYSIAIGYNALSTATGIAAGSFGYNSTARGTYSVAIGPFAATSATASSAAAFGYFAQANANYSVAAGFDARTTAEGAGAFGRSAYANGQYSVAIGYNAQTDAAGTGSGSFGYQPLARGPYSIAIGSGAQTGATANDAGSFGKGAIANGNASVAVGNGAQATAQDAGAFGKTAIAGGTGSVAIGAGASTGSSAVNASALGNAASATGSSSLSLGTSTIASGTSSVAMGYQANASGSYSMSLGYSSIASNTSATSIGYNTEASGLYSTAMGYNSIAYGEKSIAIGAHYTYSYLRCRINKLTGQIICSTVTGNVPNVARRTFSAAIGHGNTAEDGGMALGFRNNALSSGAIALGYLNTADTTQAFAAGTESVSHGINAMAIGQNVTAEAASSTVMGAYNATSTGYNRYDWVETDPLFVIGNGDENAGHDAFKILKNGQTYILPENTTYGLYQYATNNNKTGSTYGLYSYNYNSTSTNTSIVYGGRISAYNGGTGATYGVYGYGYNNSSSTGNLYSGLFSGTNYGSGSTYSGYFSALNYGSGENYGVYSEAYNSGSSNYYSGRFVKYSGSPGTNYQGLYADLRSGDAIDLAEYIYDSEGNTAAADVVVADPDKKESVIRSSKPYQASVVGVISTQPHLIMGMELVTDKKTGAPLPNVRAARLALSGRVPVNVCGENGAIKPGDYLTTSSIPGTAMKWTLLDVNAAKDFDDLKKILAENEKRRGAIIGKAVESFSGSGTSKIMVLISLQ